MPRTTVYIRNQDWEAWQKLPNKSEFISMAMRDPKKIQKVAQDMVNMKADTERIIKKFSSATQVCRTHGLPTMDNGKCLQKGCKG